MGVVDTFGPFIGQPDNQIGRDSSMHLTFLLNTNVIVQRVPALCAFWDLEKTVLHEINVSGTVVGPLLA